MSSAAVSSGTGRRRIPHTLLAGAAAFVLAMLHGPGEAFLYDAAQYWGGAAAIVAGDGPVVPGSLATRGVLTTLVYLVPAALAHLIGAASAAWIVLVWNSVWTGVVAAVLVPRLAQFTATGRADAPSPARVWTAAILTAVVLGGFAPFPLLDTWSLGLALAGVLILATAGRWWSLSLAGVAVAAAVNLRPSLIAPVLIASVVLMFNRPRMVLLGLPAAVVTLLPQLALNVVKWGAWSLVPTETAPLVVVQAEHAPYTLRYDTVAFGGEDPRQWYCDPAYASQLVDDPPARNQFDVISSAFQHLPSSLWFLTRKAAANVHWSLTTPYEHPPGHTTDVASVLVVIVCALGLVSLISYLVLARTNRERLVQGLAILGFWIGSLGTLLVSTPETRFALPLVLVGIAGTAALPIPRGADGTRRAVVVIGIGLALAIVLFASGLLALGDALPPGPIDGIADCVGVR